MLRRGAMYLVIGVLLISTVTLSGCSNSTTADATLVGQRASDLLDHFFQADIASVESYFAPAVVFTVADELGEGETLTVTPAEIQLIYETRKVITDALRGLDPSLTMTVQFNKTVSISGITAVVTGSVTHVTTGVSTESDTKQYPAMVIKFIKSNSSWLISEWDWGTMVDLEPDLNAINRSKAGVSAI